MAYAVASSVASCYRPSLSPEAQIAIVLRKLISLQLVLKQRDLKNSIAPSNDWPSWCE